MRIAIASTEELTVEEKAEIQKHIQNGTIWDCLIAYQSGETLTITRVVAINESDKAFFIVDDATSSILGISYAE